MQKQKKFQLFCLPSLIWACNILSLYDIRITSKKGCVQP